MCRGKAIMAFVMCPMINDKAIISQATIDDLFYTRHGFVPTRGETISIL